MKNILIFAFARQGLQEACQLEVANEYYRRGDNVMYVTCGKSGGICNDNNCGDPIRCAVCRISQRRRAMDLVAKNLDIQCMDDYCTDDIWKAAESIELNYSNAVELKNLTFLGIDIGYGALSSYVSYTRNIDLSFGTEFKRYINYLLRLEIRWILAGQKIVDSFKPDLIVLHNGRYAHYKPFIGLASVNNIDFLLTETITAPDGTIMKEFYHNSIPHDFHIKSAKIQSFWDRFPDDSDKLDTATSFFENRRNARFAGDTVYAKNQILGKLPQSWDTSKYNIAIFNSSEDEFFSINKDVESNSLFRTQIYGIKRIVEHFLGYPDIHFTLRVHPHLVGLPYSFHQELYKLNYTNLTIIPADSDISSYSIMEASDKVIVFGSTMGVESTYWGKPVINCGYALYIDLGVAYKPGNEEELWNYILDKKLPPCGKDGALKFGLYFMSNKHDAFKYIIPGKASKFTLLGRTGVNYNIYKLFGSSYLYSRLEKLYVLLNRRITIFHKFNNIPL